MSTSNYYVKRAGKLFGPFSFEQVTKSINMGIFSDADKISTDKMNWQTIQEFCSQDESSEPAEEPHPLLQGLKLKIQETVHPIAPVETENDVPPPVTRHVETAHSGTFQTFFSNKKNRMIAGAIVVFLTICGILYFVITGSSDAKADFMEVYQDYQQAVGVVTVTLEDSQGKLLTSLCGYEFEPDYPIGTAFAIEKNKFATNCHVAYAVKDQKGEELQSFLLFLVVKAAQANGVKNDAEFERFVNKNARDIEKLAAELKTNVRVRSVDIRLAHSNGRSLPVTGVQIHPRYQTNPKDEFRNAEYDVAILTTEENADIVFDVAGKRTLYKLAPGQDIAYIGFPMEGLDNNGHLDINKPEAILKSGTINKVTDFNNVYSSEEQNKSIIHDIPAAGGASGSPIFLPNGKVVAILWGVSHTRGVNGRVASAVQHNMALRIDALDIVKKQKVIQLSDWTGEKSK